MLFSSVAEYVHQQEPAPEKLATYSKTLLGVSGAKAIERWVADNREALLGLNSNEDWLDMVWVLLSDQLDDKFFHTVQPESLPFELARQWLKGSPYQLLFHLSNAQKGTKPWGTKRRCLTNDDIIDFCESTLGFECSLILAAVAQFFFMDSTMQEEDTAALTLFQKALKYGLPNWQSISCYEDGFADRVIAQRLCDAASTDGFSDTFFHPALESHRKSIEAVLKEYPSYFQSVLAGHVNRSREK